MIELGWGVLVDSCLEIMYMIDWERSHLENIHDLTWTYGIDVARQYFLTRLKPAISDIGKTIFMEHFSLAQIVYHLQERLLS